MKKALPLIRGLAIIGAGLMIIVAVTFSWFNNNKSSSVDEMSNSVVDVVANGSQIYGIYDNELGWHTQIQTNTVYFLPMTGNGIDFFQPSYTKKPVAGTDYTIKQPYGYKKYSVTDGKGLISMDFKLRTNYVSLLYLSSESFVTPMTLLEDGSVGSISDFAAGAIRVSVQKKTSGGYDPLFIWIPNVHYQLTRPEQVGDTYSATTDGVMEDFYPFRFAIGTNSFVSIYPTSNGAADGTRVSSGMLRDAESGILYLWGDLKAIPGLANEPLCSCRAGEEEYRLVIWLDGEDRECHDIVMGGTIEATVMFDTVVGE